MVASRGWGFCGRVLADWSLLSPNATPRSLSRAIGKQRLEDAGIVERGSWIVSTIGTFTPVGLAVNDMRIFEALRKNPKALYDLRRGVLAEVPIGDVDPALPHRVVVWFQYTLGPEPRSDRALAQIADGSEALAWWL